MQKSRCSKIKKVLSIILCFAMVLGTFIGTHPSNVDAAAVDTGANPQPKVDIAVNVPSDYQGTFLDFKQELTEKLIEQGMEPGSFRITNTKVDIDTNDLSSWYVYDHYLNSNVYNSMTAKLTPEQKEKWANRLASDSSQNATNVNIEDYFQNGKFPNVVYNYNHHVLSYEKDGMSNMAFVGYATPGWMDFMMYPATSDSTRSFEFDLDAAVLNNHTLWGGGFLMNASLVNGKLYGYALYFHTLDSANQPTRVCIAKLNGVDPNGKNLNLKDSAYGGSDKANTLGAAKKVHLTVELKRDSVTVQKQEYNQAGQLGDPVDLYRNFSIPQFTADTSNGFGPIVCYQNHGCSALSMFVYTNLAMSYETSAFDALQNVQYYQGAEQKYFINLTGTSNDPGIPEVTNKNYQDGINRMNENEIFYISNTDDGKIVKDSEEDEEGNVVKQGLGADNGFIANSDDYATQIAKYIYEGSLEGRTFQPQKVVSELPLANFYMKNTDTGEQLMTVHLQHLVNAEKYNESIKDDPTAVLSQTYIPVNIVDRSKPGTLAGVGDTIAKWRMKVYDPKNTVVYDSGWKTNPTEIPDYRFTAESEAGRWNFELTVRDNEDYESKASQTYIIAFKDHEVPIITGENTARNKATITLTDTGMGIDEDGITFMEDGRGSGVAAYWFTNDINAIPGVDDWIQLPEIKHSHSFLVDVDDTQPIVVWTRDECGNEGNKAVFQPTRVIVKDPAGDIIDEYYVIGDKPIIVLPEEEDIPNKPDDEEEKFSGWEVEGGDPITPGTDTPGGDDNTIIIKPSYSKDYAKLVYLANGGTFGGDVLKEEQTVVANSSILKKVQQFEEDNAIPTREGYRFTGWKLLLNGDATNSENSSYINNTANLEEVKGQVAKVERNEAEEIVKDTYYLVAQWEIGNYTLHLNANGGSLGSVRNIEDIIFGTVLNSLTGAMEIPVSGVKVPSKPGYIFQGWSETNTNDLTKIFKVGNGVSGITPVASPSMPASDKTIYAVWKQDTSKFIVSFDSNGGNTISDQAYLTATAAKYNEFQIPQRAGYIFDGWYEKIVDEEGQVSFGTTAYTGTEAFIKKANHTFIAKWVPSTTTRYNVDYFINSGNKDAAGNYIYTRVNDSSITKSYTAATEATVTVPEKDKLAELTVGGVKYWFNAENKNNVFEGVVTGNPTLSLRLYYDRYFEVTAAKTGNGTVNGAAEVKEGANPTVTWAAEEGSYVSKILVDGIVRDDLLKENAYTFAVDGGFHENHRIQVIFTEEAVTPPSPTPGPSEKDQYYEIATSVVGCTDSSKYEITPSTSVLEGSDHLVEWTVKDNKYRVVKVEVDGIVYDGTDSFVSFTGVQGKHKVVVTLEPTLPTIGGGNSENQYTVTVNRYGGDDTVSVSSSLVVNQGDAAFVSWDATASADYVVYKILIDGEEVSLSERQLQSFTNYSRKPLNNVQKNHVVDIYFAKKSEEGEVDPPNFTDDKYIQLTTQLVGAPGSITGGAVIEQGDNYKVDWTVDIPADNDPDSNEYVFYEIERVVVNGEERYAANEEDGIKHPEDVMKEVDLTDIQEDTVVKVYARPVLHRVTILKYGNGTVSSSKTVFHMANYKGIEAQPADGWSTAKIVVDGEVTFELPPATQEIAQMAAYAAPVTARRAMKKGVMAKNMTQEIPDIMPLEDPTPANGAKIDDLTAIIEDHIIEVYFTSNNEEGEPTPLPEDTNLHRVTVLIEGGAGTTDSSAIVSDGESQGIAWTVTDENYEVSQITVNGEKRADNAPFDLENITEDQLVVITLKKKSLDNNEEIPSTLRETTHTVTAIINGGNGTIEGSGEVLDGTDKQVTWTPGEGNEVKYVFVNGVQRDDLMTGNSVTFENITEDQTVVVIIGKADETPTNVDKDGDGKPDINIDDDGDGDPDVNIDKDGDGDPDVNVDTDDDGKPDINIDDDGDGEPDINVDTNDDGEPDINIDKDGDGKPDVNVDTDDDGEPDINIDKDGDGDPDVNIDTDDDGKPDVNVDTDGDGEPDVNIDKDGDGKPDINIVDKDGDGKPDNIDPKDPEQDKTPDVNIDKDGDGKPDVNIDKDGDGKPDVNVDKDGDGEPDINIDKDGDGKPDVNIDKDGDGKPDVNVDKDGDGEPDINIDTNGDGEPDVNVDKDGDGKPDINIDTNGDGKPELNIDTNGDGKADVNVDVDGDGKADVNIDTDGDGKPDMNIDKDGDGKPDVDSVDTGDMSGIGVYMWLLATSMLVVALVLKKRRIAK